MRKLIKQTVSHAKQLLLDAACRFFAPLSGAASEVKLQLDASHKRYCARNESSAASGIERVKEEFLAAAKESPALFFAPLAGFYKRALGQLR